MILASDGLWDVMSGEKAGQMGWRGRRSGMSAKDTAGEIMKSALRNKECKDNITVTVVFI